MAEPTASQRTELRRLTSVQRRIWASQRLHPDVPLANMGDPVRLRGSIDPERLIAAFDTVVRRSDVLRSVVVDEASVVVLDRPPAPTRVLEVAAADRDDWMAARVATPIDATACVYDSALLRHAEDDWTWWLCIHHVAVDASAAELVLRATAAAYDHDGDPSDADLSGVIEPTFFDHVDPGDAAAVPARGATPEPITLGVAPGPASTRSERRRIDLDTATDESLRTALAGPLRSISRDLGLLAIAAVVVAGIVHRLDGRRQIVVGVPLHHRMRKSDRRLLGPLMEFAPLAVDIDPDEPRGECFTRTVGAIVQLLRTRRSSGGGAQSFDTIVNVIGAGAPTFGGVVAERSWVRSDHDDPTQRLGVQVRVDPDDTTSWLLDIDPGLAPDSVRERLAGWFRSELVALCDAPQRPLRDSSLLLADDEATSAELAALAPSPSPLELDELVHETVRNSLRTRPDEWVIEHGDRVLTAWEFDEAAERIAAWLVAGGLSVGDRVGLEFDRGLDVVVAVQAVLRAGGAFVVLDPEDPLSRRRRIADEAGVSIVLDRLPAADELAAVDAVALPTVGLDDLAYVLFTSGSTGEPKGVPVSHRGLADYLRFAADAYVDPASPPVLALHSKLRFDLTITSLFLALATDGRTIVVDGDAAEALRTVAADERVTFLKATPSQLDLYRRFVVGRSCVDTLVVGGEAFRTSTADDVSAVCAPAVRVFNEYGPTEAVVGCMVHEYDPSIDRGTDVPIGRACDGAQLVVLDRVGQLAPVGVWGELYVRRPGQPSAYLGDPSRSAGWFVSLDSVDGLERVVPGGHVGSWYRTGDRARIVRTGVLVYGGRSDDQLKVNGIRLEPGEVEAAMTEHPAVSVAVVRADASGRQLVAWWQPTSDAASADPGELRAFLADRLPRHAIPTTYVRVEAMPLAASAKVDVDGLPAPSVADRAVGAGVPLATPTERAVARVWADVLDLARAVEHVEIGATDDLRDLGASSLTLLEAVAALEDEFGIRLPIAEAVTCRTVRSLAALVDAVGVDGGHARYGRAELDEPEPDAALPLSPAEEALLFEYRSDPLDVRYHGGRIVVLDDVVEPDRIERALADVVAHHQPLHVAYDRNRTALDVADALEVERCDPMSIGAFRDRVAEVRRRPFDLDRGPLVRALIAPLADGGTAVFVGKHHINGDAGTFDVLWRHVGRRLAGDDLPELRPSYAAHLRAQRLRHADADDAGRRHWRGLLAARGESSTVGLAAPDSPEPDGYLTVDASPTPERIAATGASAFVTAATALATTLSAYGTSDRADFSVAVSTRDLSAASEVVGNYLNTVPMWLDVNGGATLGSLRDDVADQTAAALAHRTVPFATIVRDSREAGLDGPVASVLLVADRAAPLELAGVRAQQEAVLSGDAVTDLTFFVRERGAGSPVELSLEYRGSVVAADDARRLLATFRAAFERLVDEPDTPAGAIGAAESAPDLVGDRLADHDLVLARWLRHAASEPGTPAVVDGEVNSLTHGELLARARQIADEVVSAVGSGSTCERVGVSVPRSCDLVAAMLGGQLAGAAVVPVDPTLPATRRALIADEARLDALIVPTAQLESQRASGVRPTVALDALGVSAAAEIVRDDAAADVVTGVDADRDAYVIFTSGSTGVPRGVAVTHRNLAASTAARDQWFDAPPERFLVTSSFGFDSSAVGLWWSLATGGTIVLPTDDEVHDVDALLATIEARDVSHLLMVPSLYEALMHRSPDRMGGVRVAIVAGEACPASLVRRHHEVLPGVDLVNEYGPTEATVWSTAHRVRPTDDPVPIGRPIPGTTVRVAGEHGRALPHGVVGELLVSGPGVTAGYVGDAAATAAAFVDLDEQRWYRTGDLAIVSDGNVRFVGRVDDQLNLGGVRVEPAEIENALRSVTTIDDAIVVAAGRPARLVAHVVAVDGADVDEATVRAVLGERLAPGAVPQRVIGHDRLPRTPNGKLDRAAAARLAIPGRVPDAMGEVVDPSQLPEPLASVIWAWNEVFDVAVGPNTDFFAIGGDSLSAVMLVTELGTRLERDVAVATVVRGRTPLGMADLLDDPDRGASSVVQVVWFRRGPGEDGPVVVMTPSWDDVFGYQQLARAMPDEVDVVAFGLDDRRSVTTVERYVDLVLSELDELRSDRPIIVVGWSIGGVVAMELAAQLEHRGDGVVAVGLVDTFFPGEERHLWSNRWWKYRSLVTPRALPEWRTEIGKVVRSRLQRLRGRFRSDHPTSVPPGDAAGDAGAADGVDRAEVAMIGAIPADAFAHEPSRVDTPVVFFAASGTNPARTHRRWQTVADDLTVVPVQGRHRGFESVMGAERVGRLVDGLRPYLRR